MLETKLSLNSMNNDSVSYLGYLQLSQSEDATKNIHTLETDVIICFVGWEERCTEITKSNLRAKDTIIYRFDGNQDEERRNKHEKVLENWAGSISNNTNRVVGAKSTDCSSNFQKFEELLLSIIRNFERQVSITLDISCCPKSLISYILGIGFSRGLLKSIDLFYAHIDYEDKATRALDANQHQAYVFTEGDWTSVQIPYLEGDYRPSAQRKLLVTMGAESAITESFIRRYQPDILNFVIPSPSATVEMEQSISSEINMLIRRFELAERNTVKVAPNDMLGCAEACKEMVGFAYDEDISIACLGTKPHAVGATIVAINSGSATIICRAPLRYKESDGKPTGKSNLYKIVDLSAF